MIEWVENSTPLNYSAEKLGDVGREDGAGVKLRRLLT